MQYFSIALGSLIGIFILAVAFGAFLFVASGVITIGCFIGAFMLMSSAWKNFRKRGEERPVLAIDSAELTTALSELSRSSKLHYAQARDALLETIKEWNSIVRHHGNASIFARTDLSGSVWPLNNEEVRAATVAAVNALSANKSPIRMLAHTRAAIEIDKAHIQLRYSIGKVIGEDLTLNA
ncbi:hypothetical protein G6014_04905 [Dietzia kunjamensis]|uniref:hypothetical protein n=1 Tax=Dietzia kunjamensis TaxID=322509 RepID=UPI0011C22788|nr:hypothetical protein [Dietzia kunjamensis]MBB1011623.1 hypothetical protein [Dietzia kunjamensis]